LLCLLSRSLSLSLPCLLLLLARSSARRCCCLQQQTQHAVALKRIMSVKHWGIAYNHTADADALLHMTSNNLRASFICTPVYRLISAASLLLAA
jgi:hypothetical protein